MDSGSDGKLSYAIQSGNTNDVFSIDQTTGEIKLAKSLDYETTPMYNLTILVTDHPSTKEDVSKAAQTVLLVSVLDVNDNAPNFEVDTSQNCRKFISDDTTLGTVAFDIKASDLDTSLNAEISYGVIVLDKASDFLNLFSLDTKSGVFSVKGDLSLDKSFPNGRELTFQYIAKDNGKPSLSTKIQCSVLITGENKHAPRLDHSDVVTVVTSSIYQGHQVTTIKASDADSGPDGTLAFSITAGNEESVFTISNSGVIGLAKQPSHGYHAFNVEVSDQASVGKRKTISCLIHVYFSALPIKNIGDVVVGDVIKNRKMFTVTKGEKLVFPISLQLGLHNLEGFDVEISLSEQQSLVEISEVSSNQYHFLRPNSTVVRFLGLTDMTKNTFGVHQIGGVTLLPISSGSVTINVKVVSMVSQELKHIKSGVALDLDSKGCVGISWNIVSDCRLDMEDASFLQSYLRAQSNGFIGSLGNKLQFVSSFVKDAMDTDQNGVLNNQDVQLLFDSLLGKALTIKNLKLAQPGTVVDNKRKCDLLIETKTLFNALDKSTFTMEDFDVYLLLSHNTEELIEQIKTSNFGTLSSVTSQIEGDMKHVLSFKMNRTTSNGIFTFISRTSAISLKNLGLSLLITNKKTGTYSTTLTQHSPVGNDAKVFTFDNMNVKVHARDQPQVKQNIEVTSSRCMNPLQTSRMRMKLDGDFEQHVAGKEEKFKKTFKTFLESYLLQKHGHVIIVTNIAVSKGSVVLEFDLQHESSDEDQIISDIVDDLENNRITMPFDGLDYPAQPTLRIGDQENVKQPVIEEEDSMSKAFIAIGVIIGFVLFFGFIGALYLCKKRDDPYATKEKQHFEWKSSGENINKYPSMVSHSKKAGVVNNAYEYFKTLDHSGAHTPNTKHVVNSLRKQPNLDFDGQTPPAHTHTAHLDETRASLRRRNTPKNLEEMQRELRVRSICC